MKRAVVIVSGVPIGENMREVEIPRGATAGDVLRSLNLQGYLLSNEGTLAYFADDECVYDKVAEGGKLRASPRAEVGSSESILAVRALAWLFWLWITGTPRDAAAARVNEFLQRELRRMDQRKEEPGRHVRVRAVRHVEIDRRSLWEQRGWQREGKKLRGAFRTALGSLSGDIDLRQGWPEFYIRNPPAALLAGRHGACFRDRGNGHYFVHFNVAAESIDGGIATIERLLEETLRGRVTVIGRG